MSRIHFKGGYKYRLVKPFTIDTPIKPLLVKPIDTEYIKLSIDGRLEIIRGYNWDGPSGPPKKLAQAPLGIGWVYRKWFLSQFMRGSLVHDALYQLMREGYLLGGNSEQRKAIDRLLQQHCLEDGMTRIRAWWIYKGVHWGARKSSTAYNIRKVQIAPKP